jgi:hypothetical protein
MINSLTLRFYYASLGANMTLMQLVSKNSHFLCVLLNNVNKLK